MRDYGNGVRRWISIHSLRGEGDGHWSAESGHVLIFQSTPSVGRETSVYISVDNGAFFYFNPLPPWGGRLLLPC